MFSLLNKEIITFTFYALPVVVVGMILFLIGLIVLLREHGSVLGRWYCAFSSAVGLYCVGAGVSYAVTVPAIALWWERIAHIGVALIPGTLFVTSSLILGTNRRFLRFSIPVVAVSISFAFMAYFTPLMIPSNVILYWGFYPRYGVVGIANIVFFACIMTTIYVLYHTEYKKSVSTLHKQRLRGMMIALGIGYVGAVDFLPAIGIQVYAFGYIPIMLFVLSIGIVIVRYRLVDITPELAASPILKTMQSAVIAIDLEGIVRVANDAAINLLGSGSDKIIEKSLKDLVSEAPDFQTAITGNQAFKNREIELPRKPDEHITLNVSSSPLNNSRGSRVGMVYVVNDISDRKDSELRLERMALHDALTGLPNRVLLFDRLKQLIALATRDDKKVAILYMDLDRFKAVNDQYGHAVGDEILIRVAERIGACVRESDTIARVGGDEFIGVCSQLDSADSASTIASKITETLSTPFSIGELTIGIGVSIGISIFPTDGLNADILFAKADRVMYRVKQASRGGYLQWTSGEDDFSF